MGKISAAKSSDSWCLKSSPAGSTGTIFGFLRLNAGFGHVLVPRWDQAEELCRLTCFGDGKCGMSPCQVHQVQPVCMGGRSHTASLSHLLGLGA